MRRIAAARLVDPAGVATTLGALMRARPVVLVFVRHFRCVFCREELARFGQAAGQVEARGFALLGVGAGPPEDLRAFVEEAPPGFPVFLDPRHEVFDALGLRRQGLFGAFAPRAIWQRLRGGGGDREAPIASTAFIALDPDGRQRFRYIGRRAGDLPAMDALLAALGP